MYDELFLKANIRDNSDCMPVPNTLYKEK